MAPFTENYEPFQTTRWSLVLEAGDVQNSDSQLALEGLCRIYWKPLYAFLRRRGYQQQDSQDLVQGLFLHLLNKREFFQRADKNRGQFRSFLLGALKHFLADTNAKESALKRGGGSTQIPLDVEQFEKIVDASAATDPITEFDRRWAMTVLDEALQRLKAKAEARGQLHEHETVFSYISGKSGSSQPKAVADLLNVSEDAFKMKASRMRKALSLSLREVVTETVATRADIAEELTYLKGLMINAF